MTTTAPNQPWDPRDGNLRFVGADGPGGDLARRAVEKRPDLLRVPALLRAVLDRVDRSGAFDEPESSVQPDSPRAMLLGVLVGNKTVAEEVLSVVPPDRTEYAAAQGVLRGLRVRTLADLREGDLDVLTAAVDTLTVRARLGDASLLAEDPSSLLLEACDVVLGLVHPREGQSRFDLERLTQLGDAASRLACELILHSVLSDPGHVSVLRDAVLWMPTHAAYRKACVELRSWSGKAATHVTLATLDHVRVHLVLTTKHHPARAQVADLARDNALTRADLRSVVDPLVGSGEPVDPVAVKFVTSSPLYDETFSDVVRRSLRDRVAAVNAVQGLGGSGSTTEVDLLAAVTALRLALAFVKDPLSTPRNARSWAETFCREVADPASVVLLRCARKGVPLPEGDRVVLVEVDNWLGEQMSFEGLSPRWRAARVRLLVAAARWKVPRALQALAYEMRSWDQEDASLAALATEEILESLAEQIPGSAP